MKQNKAFNPYGLEDKYKSFHRLLLLSTVVCSLIGSLVCFPLTQILIANGADTVWQYISAYFAEILSTCGLFATLALFVVASCHEENALRKKALWFEILSTVLFSFALRVFVYWLTAFLDSKLSIEFYFNDKTLVFLLESGAFLSFVVSSLLNLPVLLFVILLSYSLVKKFYNKSGERGKASLTVKRLPVFVYLSVAVFFAAIETVLTIYDYGIAASMNVWITLLMPYIEIALFSLIGYYLLAYLVDWFDQKEV